MTTNFRENTSENGNQRLFAEFHRKMEPYRNLIEKMRRNGSNNFVLAEYNKLVSELMFLPKAADNHDAFLQRINNLVTQLSKLNEIQ